MNDLSYRQLESRKAAELASKRDWLVPRLLRHRSVTVLLVALALCQSAMAQSEFFLWADKIDGSGYAESRGLTVHSSGNAYLCSSIYGTAAVGTNIFNSPMKAMLLVSKVSSDGEILWFQQAAGTDSIWSSAITTDNRGAVYVAGAFYGTATFGSTILNPNAVDTATAFVAKLGSDGSFLWAKKLGGSQSAWVSSIWLDSNEEAYITGFFDNNATLDAISLSSYGTRDIFVAKLDGSGTFVWATAAGGAGQDYGNAITGDATGVYINGFHQSSTAHFGSKTLTLIGNENAYVAKLDKSGTFLWARQMGGTSSTRAEGIALDASGNVYITGSLVGNADFGTQQLTNGGAFFAKLNASGDFQWVAKAGQTSTSGHTIAINEAGEVLVAGELGGEAAFGSITLTQRGTWDGYIAKLSSTGSFLWATNSAGSIYGDTPCIACAGEEIYLAGAFGDTNILGDIPLGTSAEKAIFLAKLTTQTKPVIFVNGTYPNTKSIATPGPAQISIRSGYLNPAIYYTLDGSEPSFDSILYSGPFTVAATATLKVIAYRSDFLESQESEPITIIVPRTFELAATTDGGGSVAATPPNAGTKYLSNTLISITATPTGSWTFLGWGGDATGTNNPLALTMKADTYVKAIFGTTVGTTTAGAGTVAVSPELPSYPYGTGITLTALPSLGNYFGAWGNAASGNTTPLTLMVRTPNPTISAVFNPLSAGQYALVLQSDGAGSVSVSPRGNRYPSGQTVSITASPEPGQRFLGWSGDASGQQNPLTLTMTHNTLVAANFSKSPRLIMGNCVTKAPSPDLVRIQITGNPGSDYEIQTSYDLLEWNPASNLTNNFGWVQFTEPLSNSPPQKFYRAKLIQP